jgi:hypothetical protein
MQRLSVILGDSSDTFSPARVHHSRIVSEGVFNIHENEEEVPIAVLPPEVLNQMGRTLFPRSSSRALQTCLSYCDKVVPCVTGQRFSAVPSSLRFCRSYCD